MNNDIKDLIEKLSETYVEDYNNKLNNSDYCYRWVGLKRERSERKEIFIELVTYGYNLCSGLHAEFLEALDDSENS